MLSSSLGKDAFKDKTVVVAGGSSGINLQIACEFARAGSRVAILSRSEEKLEVAASYVKAETGSDVVTFPADVRDYGAIEAAYAFIKKQYSDFDVLISGAAGNFIAPVSKMSAGGFKAVVDIDLVGSFNVIRAADEFLNPQGASIINISAPQADHPYPGQAHVSAAKSGINMLTKSLAVEWGARNIRVNAISPGPIDDTEGMRRLSATPEAKRALEKMIPLQRYGAAREIADLALFLCSDFAAYITGAVIPCDGGFSLLGAGAWGEG